MKNREESLWFQEMYLRFSKALVQFSCRAGIEPEISKEIMQQAFYLLLVKYDSLKERQHPNLPGWLIKVNSNLVKKELRSARRRLSPWCSTPPRSPPWRIKISALVRTSRITGGLLCPCKGLIPAEP